MQSAPQLYLSVLLLCRLGNIHDMELGPPPPIMKTFKEFLITLDDSVDETEAVKRYNEYKLDFRRQQMQEFFLAHKDEEWYDLKNFLFYLLELESLDYFRFNIFFIFCYSAYLLLLMLCSIRTIYF